MRQRSVERALVEQRARDQLVALELVIGERRAGAHRLERRRRLAPHLAQRGEREQHQSERLAVLEPLAELAGPLERRQRLGRGPAADRDVRLAELGQQPDLGAQARRPRRAARRRPRAPARGGRSARGRRGARGTRPLRAAGSARPRRPAALQVVQRDLLRGRPVRAERVLEALAEAAVQLGEAVPLDRLQQRGAIGLVRERVRLRARAVGPLHRPERDRDVTLRNPAGACARAPPRPPRR